MAVKGPVRVVGRALQFLITLVLTLKRTVPATEAVTVTWLLTPKVKETEEKERVAVALPVVMVIVVTVEVSAR